MHELNEISYYQLENLILQKVPFKFIRLNIQYDIVQTFKHLNPYYLRFFKEQFIEFQSENPLNEIKAMKESLETPFILICEDGKNSKKMAMELETLGYKNIYILTGGLQQLIKDMP